MLNRRLWGAVVAMGLWGVAGTSLGVKADGIAETPDAVARRAGLVGVVTMGAANGIAVIRDFTSGRTAALSVGDRLPFAPGFRVARVARGRVDVSDGTHMAAIIMRDDVEDKPGIITDDGDDFVASRPVTITDDFEEEFHGTVVDSTSIVADSAAVVEEVVVDESAGSVFSGKRVAMNKPVAARVPTDVGPEGVPLSPSVREKVDSASMGGDSVEVLGVDEP